MCKLTIVLILVLNHAAENFGGAVFPHKTHKHFDESIDGKGALLGTPSVNQRSQTLTIIGIYCSR
jgi:hypothetical protein